MGQAPRRARTEPEIVAEAERQKTALLYRNAGVAQLLNVVNASLFAYVNASLTAHPFGALVWWCLLVAVAALRYLLAHRFQLAGPDAQASAAWRRRYIVATALLAATWGAGAVLFMWHSTDAAFLFTGMVLSGMVAGAVPILSPVPAAYRAFALPILVPMAAIILMQASTPLHWAFVTMAAILLAALLAGTRRLHETLDVAIRLGLEQGSLAEHLEQALVERRQAEDEIRHLAFYDPLTGLPNRRLLMDRLGHARRTSARNGRLGALLFIDLDNFKTLNDTQGHEMGDLLLEQFGRRLVGSLRASDTVARIGGDEFVVILEGLSAQLEEAASQARLAGEKILAALDQPCLLAGHTHHSTCSIGVTLFSGQGDSVEELLKQADLSMYQAKEAGGNVLRFFDQGMQEVVAARAALEEDLRQALLRNEFELHYQPQVDQAGRLIGAEALVRWRHPERGLVAPNAFIGLAEDTGLILPIGRWVLEHACAQLAAWSGRPGYDRCTLAVNISARQFRQPDFAQQVLEVLRETGADPHRLKLELTESLLLDDMEDVIAKMALLKPYGVGFSLDDFGTGYSSLAYLKRLPLEQLKIDRSFVQDILSDANDAAICRTIIALAHSLGLAVIAEGVETEAQRDFLAGEGCHAYQGYLYGRPQPAEAMERLIEARA